MATGLTYVRGRAAAETIEAGNPVRESGQFAAPFRSAPVRAASSQRVRVPASGFTPTQGAAVIYLDPDRDSDDAGQASFGHVLNWQTDADNRIIGFYNKEPQRFDFVRRAAASESGAGVALNFEAGDALAMYVAWDETNVHAAVDGGTIQSAANSLIPASLPSSVDIGSELGGSNYFDAAYGAVALFGAPLTQTQWEALAALRDRRPPCYGERSDGAMTALWYGTHTLVRSADAALDLNDADDGDFQLLRLDGAGTAPVVNRVVQTPQRDGAVYIDTRLAPRLLTANLAVVGTGGWSSMWEKRREIAGVLNPRRGAGVLMFAPDDTVYEVNAVVEQGLTFSNPRGPHAQEQPVTFLCDDPAWRIAAQNEATIIAPAGGAAVETSVPLSLTASGGTATLTNEGDLPSFPHVHIEIDKDATDAPKLASETVAREFVLGSTFDDIDSLDIDMDARTALDASGADVMGLRTSGSQMWTLEPGDNSVSADMSGGALTARFRWWTRLIGI